MANAKLRAGVDLGGTKIQVAIMDQSHNVIGTDRRPTPTVGTPDDVTDSIADSIRAAVNDANVQLSDIAGIGVGAPGQVDHTKGTLSNAGNLPGWMLVYPLSAQLSKRVGGIPVALGNDVQVGVNAEVRLGAGRDYRSLIGVFCGTGVGGGVVMNREIWVGRGAAGEIGHVCIQAKKGAPCTCGRTGCMEAYAGRAAMEIQARKWHKQGQKTELFKIMKKKGKPRLASGVWDEALHKRDPMAMKLINRAVWALGVGIADAVNLMDVQAVIIGGGLGIRLGQPFVDAIKTSMTPHLLKSANPPAVLLAELGDMGGAMGASLLAEQFVTAAPSRTPARKAPAKKAPVKKTAAKKAPVKKAVARKAPVRTATTTKKAATR